MHTMRYQKVDRLWTVGYECQGVFHALSDHDKQEEAEEQVAFLNGYGPTLTDAQMDALAALIPEDVAGAMSRVVKERDQAKAAAAEYRRHLVELVELWTKAGIRGFINSEQTATTAFIVKIGELVMAVRRSENDF